MHFNDPLIIYIHDYHYHLHSIQSTQLKMTQMEAALKTTKIEYEVQLNNQKMELEAESAMIVTLKQEVTILQEDIKDLKALEEQKVTEIEHKSDEVCII